MTTSCS